MLIYARLTEPARRIVPRASAAAAADGRRELSGRDVLWALALSGGQAARLVGEHVGADLEMPVEAAAGLREVLLGERVKAVFTRAAEASDGRITTMRILMALLETHHAQELGVETETLLRWSRDLQALHIDSTEE